jgi:hypothetical protein
MGRKMKATSRRTDKPLQASSNYISEVTVDLIRYAPICSLFACYCEGYQTSYPCHPPKQLNQCPDPLNKPGK